MRTLLFDNLKNKRIALIFSWLLLIGYMALIVFLSSRPAPESVKKIPIFWGIKGVHICEYSILFLLWFQTLSLHFKIETKTDLIPKAVLVAALLSFIFGLTDEWHQSFVPSRTAQWIDVISNSLGIIGTSWGVWKLKKKTYLKKIGPNA